MRVPAVEGNALQSRAGSATTLSVADSDLAVPALTTRSFLELFELVGHPAR